MNITPSAASQQLTLLEKEAGVELLEKSGRRVRLTSAGLLLVQHADKIIGDIYAAEDDMLASQHWVTGVLKVAAFPTCARAVMPQVMTALSLRHPALRVTLTDLEPRESLAALRLDEIDVAIVDESDELTRGLDDQLEVEEFLNDPLYLVLPPDQPVTPNATLAGLRDAFWIMARQDSEFFRVALRACRASGFEPRIRSHCKDFSVIIALIEDGLGVGILSSLALYDRPLRATVLPTEPPLTRNIAAVIRRDRRSHPALALMMSELRRFGASYVPAFGRPLPDQ
jgi:DNA-binding transcriptional LysR family regulator